VFEGWGDFFFLMGSAGGGLIGLLFVVVTLTANAERSQVQRGQGLYLTPTAGHFGVVLTISAVALVPRLAIDERADVFAAVALVGLALALRACIGIGAPGGGMSAHWSDFWLYGAAPAALYLGLAGAALALWSGQPRALLALAALLIALLLLAIRNAWDLVTWMAPKAAGLAGPPAQKE
jgi:hypothetical protein